MFTKHFKNLTKSETNIAGGKGASLGEMTQANIPVPKGFVILTDAFEKFLDETDLRQEIRSELNDAENDKIHTVEKASKNIQNLILNKEIPDNIKEEIQKEFKNLSTKYVAVRSSATAEDSKSAAWAGQLDTFLNTTEDDLLENVKRCWASLFTPRAIFYRFEQGLKDSHVSVAVVIQKMIDSEKSGIAFSVHPVTEDPNQLIIEAGFGLGEAVVSGSITPDAYTVSKKDNHIIDINVNEQSKALYRNKDGGNTWRELREKGKEQVLTEEQIIELSNLIKQIENHYGSPQDIEWAYENNKFYITQSRPITTLNLEKESANKGIEKIQQVLEKNGPLSKTITYPFTPVIWFEAMMPSYINNPLFSLLDFEPKPLTVALVDDEFEAWSNLNLRPIVKDVNVIKEIDKKTLEMSSRMERSFEKILQISNKDLKNPQIFIETLKKANSYTTEIYYHFAFYIDESFETDDEKLIHKLQKTRMVLDTLILDYHYKTYGKFIDVLIEEYNFPREIIERMTTAEIEKVVKNPETISDFKEIISRPIAFIHLRDKLETITGDDVLTIKKFLREQDPHKEIVQNVNNSGVLKGITGNKGVTKGLARIVTAKEYHDTKKLEVLSKEEGIVLVIPMTSPELVPYFKNVNAFVTDEGGITCHASIIARELGIPCIVGTKVATEVLKDGDMVEVDADNGVVKILEKQNDFENYKFSYQSQGYNFLLEDMIINSYVSWPLIVLGLGNWVRKYTPKEIIDKNKSTGLLHTKEEINKKLKNIQQIIEKLQEVSFEDISKEMILDLFKDLARLLEYYSYFDTSYSEGIYIKDSKDSRSLLIEQSKNVIRDDFDYIFFRENGLLEKLIQSISGLTKTNLEQIRWYRMDEIELLIDENKKIKTSDIEARKKAYVFNRNNSDQVSFLIGDEAISFIETFEKNFKKETATSLIGTVAHGKGKKVVGNVCIIHRDYSNYKKFIDEMNDMKKGNILVTTTTDPEFMPAIKKSSAIITDIGGFLSHAAISARELNIPCIVGTEYATKILKSGDMVEVDADNGVVRILDQVNNKSHFIECIKKSKKWMPIVERHICLLIRDLILSGEKSAIFNKALGVNIDPIGDAIVMDHVFSPIESIENTNKALQELVDKYGYQKIMEIGKSCTKRAEELHKYLELTKEADLVERLREFKNLYTRLTCYLLIVVFSEKFLEKQVENLIKEKVGSEDKRYFEGIVYPRKFNKNTEELIAILKLSKLTKDKKLNIDDGIATDLIQKHAQEFGWLGTRWQFEDGWNIEDIKPRIKRYINGNPEKELQNVLQPREEAEAVTKEFIQKFNLNTEEERLIDLVKEFVFLRTFRTESIARANFLVKPFLREASKKLKISKSDIQFLSVDEIITMITSKTKYTDIINERKKEGHYMILCEDTIEIFTGDEKKLIDNLNIFNFDTGGDNKITGQIAWRGTAKGRVKIVRNQKDIANVQDGDVLVAVMTFPNYISAMEKASAFVTDEGGILCHAAIVAREMKKPCIIGTKVSTKILKDGDMVEVDADNGIVKVLEK